MSVQQWFKKFWKGDESIEDEECSGWPSEVDNNQFRAILKLILINYRRSCWTTQCWPFYSHQHLKQTGKVKTLIRECLMSWADRTKKKKPRHFEVLSSLILHSNNKPFLEQIVTWNEKWFVYSNQQWPTQWMDWEKASKPNLHPQKRSWSLFGGLLLVWSTIALVKPLHLRSMLNKLMRCTKNCNTFSQHCPAKGSSSPPWLLPTACHTTNIQQLSKLGYKVLPPPPYSTELLRTDYTSSSILTTFYRENTFTVSRRQKMLSKGSSRSQSIKKKRSQSMDFTLQDGTNLFLIGKNVLIEMVPILN